MQTEAVPTTENPALPDSKQSKRTHGGKRPGAGRKPNLAKRVLAGVRAKNAADILAGIDTQALVDDLLKNGSRQLKWQVLTALWERVYGRCSNSHAFCAVLPC